MNDDKYLKRYRENPTAMVYEQFGVLPDRWQEDFLIAFASQDKEKMRIAIQSCTGPGKSAALSWCILNFMACYVERGEHPKGAAISISESNLKDNLWSELNKWHQRSEWFKHHFEWTQTSYFNKANKPTWFMAARSYSKTANPQEAGLALSGIHSKFVLFVIDEAGGVPGQLLKIAEQAMSAESFAKIVLAGNPTNPSPGIALYDASKDPRYFKIKITADPFDLKRTPRVSKEHALAQIEKYGKDDPWVLSTIYGEFPETAVTGLLSEADLDIAERRVIRPVEVELYQKSLGVDCARFGYDSSIIFPRQGSKTFKYVELRKADGSVLANRVMGAMSKWKDVDFINVDDTGGYGSSCIDFLRAAHQNPNAINFSSSAQEPERFFNRRAEMYWRMADWIKKSGSLLQDQRLRKELGSIQYSYRGNKLIIESKDQIKSRLGFSPDVADALALTFAFETKLKQNINNVLPTDLVSSHKKEYNPWEY